MFVRHLALRSFRSWYDVTLDLTPGCTVFLGPNGHGKTNLLEAIHYLSALGSHRVATDQPLIQEGCDAARITGIAVNAGRELRVDVELHAGRANKAKVNQAPVRRPREILGIVQSVLFAPEDLSLVKGDPGERRRFIDELLVTRRPQLAAVRADYDRILRQRSALLKSLGASRGRKLDSSALTTLEVWDGHLAETGSELLEARLALIHELQPFVTDSYAGIAPGSRPAIIEYRCSLGDEALGQVAGDRAGLADKIVAVLRANRDRELDRGVCLVGPHRDDLELRLGEQPAKGYASHGESWSFALALRLGSFGLLRADGTDPVLLLDDVFAELDTKRREALARHAAGAEQVLITAAVEDDVPAVLAASVRGVRAEMSDPGDNVVRRVSRLSDWSRSERV
ncbi:DNA replication/repair protein RecF [Hoyosella sp. YIM 151337]|uniref:DNA replication/repair protein RecF n=1 Tax=Hoyosella sp. YIM 151337 TaxID=2992742 RepID=UPI00223668BE|nr:DNA replication/repair protein RecF [Hoyosella sp. YIM 151337]MCW4354787.1 DNA replication/repair protein RecF [Hoyosella sp. YIM 151337]